MATADASDLDPSLEAALARVQHDLEHGDVAGLQRALHTLEQMGRERLPSHPTAAAQALINAARIATLLRPEHATTLLDLAEPAAVQAGLLGELWRARAEALASTGAAGTDLAWQQAAALGDPDLRRAALLRLADLRRTSNDPAGAAAVLAEALALPSVQGREQAAYLMIDRSACLAACGDDAGAAAELANAEALIRRLGSPPALRSRLLGQRGALHAKAERFQDALAVLREARQAAVEATDVQAYLAVVVLLTGVYMALGQEVDAYDAMVRARVSLKDLLGPPGEQLVQPAIDSFAQRLGARFDSIRDQWIAARRAQHGRTPKQGPSR